MGGLIGLLSTIILVSTLATLLFAIVSYFASKKLFPSSDSTEEDGDETVVEPNALANDEPLPEPPAPPEEKTVGIAKVEPFSVINPGNVPAGGPGEPSTRTAAPEPPDEESKAAPNGSIRKVELPEIFGPRALETAAKTRWQ